MEMTRRSARLICLIRPGDSPTPPPHPQTDLNKHKQCTQCEAVAIIWIYLFIYRANFDNMRGLITTEKIYIFLKMHCDFMKTEDKGIMRKDHFYTIVMSLQV